MLQLNNKQLTAYAFLITGDTVFFIDLFRSTMSTCLEFIYCAHFACESIELTFVVIKPTYSLSVVN